MIKYLHDNGVNINVIGGMYGKHSREIEYEEIHKEKICGKKPYYMVCCSNTSID